MRQQEPRLYFREIGAGTKTPGPAEPAILGVRDESTAGDIAASAVDDVPGAHEVARKPFSILLGDADDAFFDYTPVCDVYRHNRRNAVLYIIARM